MSRDVSKLRVFSEADALVLDIYGATRGFPAEERYGLQSQLRRAAVSVPCNLVEGGARRGARDFLHFVSLAVASASETRYLLSVARRLELLAPAVAKDRENRYTHAIRALQQLITSLELLEADRRPHRATKPIVRARGPKTDD